MRPHVQLRKVPNEIHTPVSPPQVGRQNDAAPGGQPVPVPGPAAVVLGILLTGGPTASAQTFTPYTITISAPASVTEGTGAVFTITAERTIGTSDLTPQDLAIGLQQVVKNNCATAGCDADTTTTTTLTTATISLNQRSVAYTVPTESDEADEFDGSVTVTVQPPSGNTRYQVGNPATDTVVVADDEAPPAVEFTDSTGSSSTENYGRITASVRMTPRTTYKGDVTVDWAVVPNEVIPGSTTPGPTEGLDFLTSSGTATFPVHVAGTDIRQRLPFDFPIVDDELDEADEETFLLELSNPQGADATIGEISRTGMRIRDDDLAQPQPAPDVSPAGTSALTVEWAVPPVTAANAFSGYNVQYRLADGVVDDNTPAWTDGPQNVDGLSADITGLDEGIEYQVRVEPRRVASALVTWSAIGTGTSSPLHNQDGDNLIEITNLAQLNAIRWDPDGDGEVADANQANYAAAFPGAAGGIVCAATCLGYELTADLDFDTDGSGAANDADDYWNDTWGWDPIEGYTADFNGNGHGISNMFINRSGSHIGLFGTTNGAFIHHLGLIDVNVSQRGIMAHRRAAPLVGTATGGTIAAVFATGSITGGAVAAGLVANTSGNIFASWSNMAVRVNHDPDAVGVAFGLAGGVPGAHAEASYAVGSLHGGTSHMGAAPTTRR